MDFINIWNFLPALISILILADKSSVSLPIYLLDNVLTETLWAWVAKHTSSPADKQV